MESKLVTSSKRLKEDLGYSELHHCYNSDLNQLEIKEFDTVLSLKECVLKPGMGFLPHKHDGVFMIIFPITGAMEQKRSDGSSITMDEGTVVFMNETNTGPEHFEYNKSDKEKFRCLVIELQPSQEHKISFNQLTHYSYTENSLTLLNLSPSYYGLQKKVEDPFLLYYGKFTTEKQLNYQFQKGSKLIILNITATTTVNETHVLKPMDSLFLWDCNKNLSLQTSEESSFLILEI